MADRIKNAYENVRNSDNAGSVHGIGIPGQVGQKKGTFTENRHQTTKSDKPPAKMN